MPQTSFISTLEPLRCPQPDVEALVACLACVGRVDQNKAYRILDGLIFQELTQLIERPTIRASAFSLVPGFLVGPFFDARQVLNRYCGISLLGAVDDMAADSVVHPCLESLFSTGQPFQAPFGAFCAFRLERSPNTGKLISNLLSLFPGPAIPFRRISNVAPPEVYPNHVGMLLRAGALITQLNVDVVLTISVFAQRSSRWLSALELPCLVITQDQGNMLTAINQGQGGCIVFLPIGKDTSVIVYRSSLKRLHFPAFTFSCFAVGTNTSASPNGQVCRQAKPSPQVMINLGLNGPFARYPLANLLISPVAGISKSLHRLLYFLGLGFSWLKFTGQC